MHLFGLPASSYEKFLRTGNLSYLYQMDAFDTFVVAAYFLVLGILSFYGLHRYLMVFLLRRHRTNTPVVPVRFEDLPRVTVQVPVYNEMYVVERIIDAVCALDYPLDRLDIQILDLSVCKHRFGVSETVPQRSSGTHRSFGAFFVSNALAILITVSRFTYRPLTSSCQIAVSGNVK